MNRNAYRRTQLSRSPAHDLWNLTFEQLDNDKISVLQHCLSRSLQDSPKLEKAIVDVYVAIREYAAAMKTANKPNFDKRVLKTLQTLPGQPLKFLQLAVTSKGTDIKEIPSIASTREESVTVRDIMHTWFSICRTLILEAIAT